MKYYTSHILRFQEGVSVPPPSPEALISFPPPGLPPSAGHQLLILIDLTPPLHYRCRELRTLTVDTYWQSSGSVVARMRRALAEANRHLILSNRDVAPGNKCSGALTCAVFLTDELFLGHVGAAYTFIKQPEAALQVYPKRDRLLIPLGGARPPMIHISYAPIEPRTTVLLTTTTIAESRSRDLWQAALTQPTITETRMRLANTLSRTPDFRDTHLSGTVILAHGTPASASDIQGHPWHLPPPEKDVPVTPPQATPNESPPTPRAPQPKLRPAYLQRQPSAAPPASQAEPAPPPEEPAIVSPPAPQPSPMPEENVAVQPDAQTESAPTARAFTWPRITLPHPAVIWETGKRIARPLRRIQLRARIQSAARALLPGEITAQTTPTRVVPSESFNVTGSLALSIVLVVTLITFTIYRQFGGTARAAELLEDAEMTRELAYSTQDVGDWRQVINKAEQIITIDPQNTHADILKIEAQDAIDSLENAAILETHLLLNLGTAPKPRRIVYANEWVYILDSATDEVLGLQLMGEGTVPASDAPITLLKRGQTFYGEAVTHLVDVTWVEPGTTYRDGALFIYSDNGLLYIYEPNLGPGSITRQRIHEKQSIGAVTLINTYGEKLYLVERRQNQLLTYEPVNGIYDTARHYFPPGHVPDLQHALDIATDGRVYLLMGDGTIRPYFNSTEDPSFTIKGLPDPDLKPTVMAIEDDPEHGKIYLGDSQRERIVVLDKHGNFLHQFRLPGEALQRMETLTVNESPHVLYLIAGNNLYAAPIPTFVGE